jgi:hypothetical protein
MRRLAYVLLTALILFGMAEGYPLQGSNGAVNCTIFGIFKDPWSTGNVNADRYSVLNADLSLTRANNSSDSTPIPAAFSLTDGNDRVYKMSPEYTREYQSGRRLIGFVVPKETIAKSLTVDLSANRAGGEQFTIPFPGLSNSSDSSVTLLYYGVLKSWTDSNKRTFEFDISVSNNGTKKLPLSARNFSLIDQWGWMYSGRDRDPYGRTGFPAVVLEPNQTLRSGLLFSSLSPLSRPVELVYQYSANSSLAINIDSEAGLRPWIAAIQSCGECGRSSGETSPSSLAGSIKASKARLAKVKGNITEGSPPKGRDEL